LYGVRRNHGKRRVRQRLQPFPALDAQVKPFIGRQEQR